MDYNTEHFSLELNKKFEIELTGLMRKQNHILEFLSDFLTATNYQSQLPDCYCFVELVVKIRLNLEAANDLLSKLLEDYRFKVSINILYRGIVDDMINAYYLMNVVDHSYPESLSNELNILQKEFLKSTQEGVEAEIEYQKFLSVLFNEEYTDFYDFQQESIKDNPKLYKDGQLKNNSQLRETSNPNLQEALKETNKSSFISEAKKLQIIGKRGFKMHAELKGLYKYLSQYQHYSPKMHSFLLTDIALEISVYNRVVFQLLAMIDMYFQFIKFDDIDRLKKYFDDLMQFLHGEN